jgi:hypothetical protein
MNGVAVNIVKRILRLHWNRYKSREQHRTKEKESELHFTST